MDEVPEARGLSGTAVEDVVRTARPGWELLRADPVERGFCTVYRVVVDAGGSERTLYLKASPDGEAWSIPTEARLQAVLAERTAIPVPPVLSAADDHPDLPTPHYLMTGLPGEALAYERIGRLDDDALERLARETGEHLAELHGVDAVESFGYVRHEAPELAGEKPAGDPDTLTVGDPRTEWSEYLRERVEAALDRHEDSQFSGLTADLRSWFEAGVDDLEGPFDPVLGRNDHGLHNLLVDPDSGAVTGVLDWGYTLAVPAAFDFEFAVYLYGGSFLAGLPGVEDRRELVREAMRSGYRAVAPGRAERVATPRPLYGALAAVRIMNDFEHLSLPDDSAEAARERVRSDLRELLSSAPWR